MFSLVSKLFLFDCMKKVLFLFVLFVCSTSARAQVLAEFFSNTDCTNCVVPDNLYDDYVKAHPDLNIIQVIYHNSTPFPNDPFYLASQADVDARQDITSSNAHYNVEGDPVGVIDGIFSATGSTSFPTWKTSTEEAVSFGKLQATLVVTASLSANAKINIDVKVTVAPSIDKVYVLPYVMLVESGIVFANPKHFGNPNGGLWNNIFRAAVPRKDLGEPFVLTDTVLHYSYDAKGKIWYVSNMKVVVAMQDVNPVGKSGAALYSFAMYGIGQTAQGIQLAGVTQLPSFASNLGEPTPNPASSSVSVPFTLAQPSFVHIAVNDMLGRTVAILANGVMTEGNNAVAFAPKEHTAGVYIAMMSVNGKFIGSKKIVLR